MYLAVILCTYLNINESQEDMEQIKRVFKSLTGIPSNGLNFLMMSFTVSDRAAVTVNDCRKHREKCY